MNTLTADKGGELMRYIFLILLFVGCQKKLPYSVDILKVKA